MGRYVGAESELAIMSIRLLSRALVVYIDTSLAELINDRVEGEMSKIFDSISVYSVNISGESSGSILVMSGSRELGAKLNLSDTKSRP